VASGEGLAGAGWLVRVGWCGLADGGCLIDFDVA